jgi:hypothetical protein
MGNQLKIMGQFWEKHGASPSADDFSWVILQKIMWKMICKITIVHFRCGFSEMVQVLKRGICAWMQYIPLVCMVQKNDK